MTLERRPLIGLMLASLTLMPAAAMAAPARPAAKARPAPAPAPVPDEAHVVLTTALGQIVLRLDGKAAPITTGNFLRYVDQRRLDGTVFYRTMRLTWGTQPNGLIQGGAQNDPKRILKPIAHEATSQTGLRHLAGTISMARWAPGTATGDFSIMLADMESLDANPKASGDNLGYAAFGRVIHGMDVVRKIFDAPINPAKGEGALKGQLLAAPVKILTARRAVPPPMLPVAPTAPNPAPPSPPLL